MKRTKVKCELCGQQISKSNISKHMRRHRVHPETFKKPVYAIDHKGLVCQFCSKELKNSNSLCNHERLCKENPNRQESYFIKYNAEVTHGKRRVWNKGLTKDMDERVNRQSKSLSTYYQTHPGVWTGKKHTEEEKKNIGIGVKKFLENNPNMVPYLRNHASKESYPEKYFTEQFLQRGFILEKQYSVGSYHLDFCDIECKVDIEIDGEQHYLDKRIIEHDIKRNKYLEEHGWIVFRIRWSQYQKMNDKEKESVFEQIQNLLKR